MRAHEAPPPLLTARSTKTSIRQAALARRHYASAATAARHASSAATAAAVAASAAAASAQTVWIPAFTAATWAILYAAQAASDAAVSAHAAAQQAAGAAVGAHSAAKAREEAVANAARLARQAAKEDRRAEWEAGVAEGARLRRERTPKLTPSLTLPHPAILSNPSPPEECPNTRLQRKVMAAAYMKGIIGRIRDTFRATEQAAEPRRRRRRERAEVHRQWHRRRRQRRDAETARNRRERQQLHGGRAAEQGVDYERRGSAETRRGRAGGSDLAWARRGRGGKRAETEFLDQSGRKRTSHYG